MVGSQASYVFEDLDYVQRSISNLTETGLESFKKHPLSYILDKLQYIAEASETATRLTTYVKARDTLAAQRSDGKVILDDKRHAALTSRNVTIDFAKAETSPRKANRVFAFANAAVMHGDDDKKKIYRDLHDCEKETYWYFGDRVHIPKSMDIGIRLT